MSRWCIFGTSLEGALGVLGLLKLDPLVSSGLARRGRLGRVGLEKGLGLRLLDYLALRSVVQRGRQRLFGKFIDVDVQEMKYGTSEG